ncbi:MAG: hypothetical protein K5912_02475 [Alphaproteobacteria bacterium]|nr:hypothetical protein [Alphaproteobacteria bacterium]
MKQKKRIFSNKHSSRGTVLMEFLLAIALAGLLLPFIYQYQQRAIVRAENLKVTKQMQKIQHVLENYIIENKDKMLTTVGRNIIRLNLSDLVKYGLDEELVRDTGDKYQIRVLKSVDNNDQASLQGVIVFDDVEITPLRTREIVSMGDDKIGFVDGTRVYGGFGTWRMDISDLGINNNSGIVQTTSVNRDNSLYLWRVPSDSASDATMLSELNLGGRDIKNVSFVNANGMSVEEFLDVNKLAVNDLIFKNYTTIDSDYKSQTGIVSGVLSGDARSIGVNGTFSIADFGRFSDFTAENLWVNTLSLGGLSTESDKAPVLRATQTLDMTEGRISALNVTVGFTGSLTSKLVVREKIVDSVNHDYYWDVKEKKANMGDMILPNLSDMATKALRNERVSGSASASAFGSVVSNKNATVSDFINAISEIQTRVRAKYHLLNLE